jgi:hypothetical protein
VRALYAALHEVGEAPYRAQCRLVVQVVLVFSDFGAFPVAHRLLAEEAAYLVQELPTMMQLDDVALVADALRCCGILQVSPCWALEVPIASFFFFSTLTCPLKLNFFKNLNQSIHK